jgi:hypothetical protein
MFQYIEYVNVDDARIFKLREIYRLYAGEMLKCAQSGATNAREVALSLCKIKGLIRTDLEEKNELSESALIRFSAEGDALSVCLLLAAGADPNSVSFGKRFGSLVLWSVCSVSVPVSGAACVFACAVFASKMEVCAYTRSY